MLIVAVVNTIIVSGLEFGDVTFRGDVIIKVSVAIEMIGCDAEDNCDMWRSVEIPKLEAAHFINNDVLGLDLVK